MYHCEAVNVVGKQKKYFRLKVLVVPTISGPSFTRLEHGTVFLLSVYPPAVRKRLLLNIQSCERIRAIE